jgi:hypothetical protein
VEVFLRPHDFDVEWKDQNIHIPKLTMAKRPTAPAIPNFFRNFKHLSHLINAHVFLFFGRAKRLPSPAEEPAEVHRNGLVTPPDEK